MSITFPTYKSDLPSLISNRLSDCMKRPIVVQAFQLDCEFRVESLEGDYAQGKAGDYLMCGINDELYICAEDVFKKTYDFCATVKE